jgi:OHCU decarboxylase
VRLDELNRLDVVPATRELRRCCGSTHWAERMAAARPFTTVAAAAAAADAIGSTLDRSDWLEAFAAHPRIGGVARAGEAGSDTARWSADEQAGASAADDALRGRLADANRSYEAQFGHRFIVCAAGRTAGEMLDALTARLVNNPDDELRVAAEEQRKITRLRLAKLLE